MLTEQITEGSSVTSTGAAGAAAAATGVTDLSAVSSMLAFKLTSFTEGLSPSVTLASGLGESFDSKQFSFEMPTSGLNIVPPEHMFIQGWKSGTYVLDQVDRFAKQIYDVMMPFYC
nr:hypothetical protein Iba_chr04fCG9140 [Ipomoea batatas]